MTDDPTILALLPYTGLDDRLTPGSVRVTAGCGHPAWISPSGIETQARTGATTRCTACIDPADVTEIGMTPELYRELVTMFGVTEADALIEMASDPANRSLLFGR